MESILRRKGRSPRFQYEVKWKKCLDPTWVPLQNLTRCGLELLKFELHKASSHKNPIPVMNNYKLYENEVFVEW